MSHEDEGNETSDCTTFDASINTDLSFYPGDDVTFIIQSLETNVDVSDSCSQQSSLPAGDETETEYEPLSVSESSFDSELEDKDSCNRQFHVHDNGA